jgi:hypothetical protein
VSERIVDTAVIPSKALIRTTALLRYTLSDLIRSQRWVAPMLCFAVFEAIVDTTSGSVLPSYAGSATILLFIATWLTIAILDTEDPLQSDITIVSAGNGTWVRVSKLFSAFAVVVGLAAVGLISPPLTASQTVPWSYIAAGAVAHLVTGIAGVTVGAVFGRPIVGRTAWAMLAAVAVDLADIVIPHGVPTRQILVLFNETPVKDLPLTLLAISAETVGVALVLLGASIYLTRLRS